MYYMGDKGREATENLLNIMKFLLWCTGNRYFVKLQKKGEEDVIFLS